MKLHAFYISRNLSNNRKRKIRFDIWFSMIGIVIAVMTLTAAISLFDGYTSTLKESIFRTYAHILIYPNLTDEFKYGEIDSLSEFLAGKEIVKGFATISAKQAMLSNDSGAVRGVYIRGVDLLTESYKSHLSKSLVNNSFDVGEGEIVLGRVLADELNISLKDTISVINPTIGGAGLMGFRNKRNKFVVVDFYESGMYEQDNTIGLISADSFKDTFGSDGITQWLEVLLFDNSGDVEKISKEWSKEVFRDYLIYPWSYFNQSLFSLLEWQRGLLFVILLFLVLIASFNMIGSVSTSILDKKPEIGILKAIGCSNHSLKKLYLSTFVGLAVIAVLIGIILGIFLAWIITKQTLLGINGDVYFIDVLTMKLNSGALIAIFFSSLAIITLSTSIPLRQINKMVINEILRERN